MSVHREHELARPTDWVTLDSLGATGREGGATGFVKLGGTLSKSVLLGGEVNAWVKSEGGVTPLSSLKHNVFDFGLGITFH